MNITKVNVAGQEYFIKDTISGYTSFEYVPATTTVYEDSLEFEQDGQDMVAYRELGDNTVVPDPIYEDAPAYRVTVDGTVVYDNCTHEWCDDGQGVHYMSIYYNPEDDHSYIEFNEEYITIVDALSELQAGYHDIKIEMLVVMPDSIGMTLAFAQLSDAGVYTSSYNTFNNRTYFSTQCNSVTIYNYDGSNTLQIEQGTNTSYISGAVLMSGTVTSQFPSAGTPLTANTDVEITCGSSGGGGLSS